MLCIKYEFEFSLKIKNEKNFEKYVENKIQKLIILKF